jgi:putative acetyltransferase
MSACVRGAPARTGVAIAVRLRDDRDDLSIFELVNEACFRHGASHLDPFPALDGFRAWLSGLGDTRFETVAEIDGQVVGFCGLYILPQRRNHCAWFFLGVRESFQGNGVGKRLLQTTIAAADILFGLGRLELTVFADNEKALSLYRKFGFEIEGRHRNFVHRGDERVDAYSMARIRAEAGPPNSVEELQERIRELACWFRSRLAE